MTASDRPIETQPRRGLRTALLVATAFGALSALSMVDDTVAGTSLPWVLVGPGLAWAAYWMKWDRLAWLFVLSPILIVIGVILLFITSG